MGHILLDALRYEGLLELTLLDALVCERPMRLILLDVPKHEGLHGLILSYVSGQRGPMVLSVRLLKA